MQPALIVLADGTWYEGETFGYTGSTIGEVVFNTSMSGYQEILTDPSYAGQVVTMTAPHIGNYGANPLDVESERVHAAGLIVRSAARRASNQRATMTLQEYLVANQTVAITGVDTRALTRRIRDLGAVMGAIVHGAVPTDAPRIAAEVRAAPSYESRDFVAECSVRAPMRVVLHPTGDRYVPTAVELVAESTPWGVDMVGLKHVVVVDYGVKYGILRRLVASGLRVTVVPHNTSASAVLDRKPDGILLSNGPGDPGRMDAAVEQIRLMLGAVPTFGICLGHQLMARATGGSTFKLKFGHRGPNQPVRDEASRAIQITSQNHGYAVQFGAVTGGVEISHINLNDQTVEGLRIPSLRAFSVQHHPEAGPGPHDAAGLFAEFQAAVQA